MSQRIRLRAHLDLRQRGGQTARLWITCLLTDVIEARNALEGAGLVDELTINWVWNPPWGPNKITGDGREQLRALGFTG